MNEKNVPIGYAVKVGDIYISGESKREFGSKNPYRDGVELSWGRMSIYANYDLAKFDAQMVNGTVVKIYTQKFAEMEELK